MGEEFALQLTDGSLNSQPSYSPTHAPNGETVSWKEWRNAVQWWKGTVFNITICQYHAAHSWIALDASASMRWGQSRFRVHFLRPNPRKDAQQFKRNWQHEQSHFAFSSHNDSSQQHISSFPITNTPSKLQLHHSSSNRHPHTTHSASN